MATVAPNWCPENGNGTKLPNQVRLSPWCDSAIKRTLDIIISTVVLVLTLPLCAVIALLIKLTSRGPVLYVHERVGRYGKPFQMIKFRSMVYNHASGACLTREGDQRVTGLGQYLRKWKLDELPQLINVIRGDVSLIGPRPHMRRLLGEGPDVDEFLSLQPGVTGLATMLFRHEESILPKISGAELEAYYRKNILPDKIRLEIQYAQRATFYSDILILLRTVQQILSRKTQGEAAIATSQKVLARRVRLLRAQFQHPYAAAYGAAILLFVAVAGGVVLSRSQRPGLSVQAHAQETHAASNSGTVSGKASSREGSELIKGLGEYFRSPDGLSRTSQKSAGDPSLKVWADLKTGLYYCPGEDMYGRTRKGRFLSQRDAELEHFQAASRTACDFDPKPR